MSEQGTVDISTIKGIFAVDGFGEAQASPKILRHISAIEPYYYDESISEITMLPSGRVMIERDGLKIMTDVWVEENNRASAARVCCRLAGGDCSEERPLASVRLEDEQDCGYRLSAVADGISIEGTTLSLRKFRKKRFTAQELIERGMFSQALLNRLVVALETRQNILISGAVNTGKTSLVNALGAFLPPDEHVVVIEDTSEIVLPLEKVVRLQAREPRTAPGGTLTLKGVTTQDLLQQSLRLNPDRIIVGEVRGADAWDLILAMNTGCQGTVSTIHADSAQKSLSRLFVCASMGTDLRADALMLQIADSVNVLVHIERRHGCRRIDEVLEVKGYKDGVYEFESWPLE